MSKISFSIFVLFILFLLFMNGCNKPPNPDGRMDVSGKITFNDGPFIGADMCAIAFTPIDDPSLGSSSIIFNGNTGKYLLTKQDGLKPGRYKVTITAQAVYDKRTHKPITAETLEGDDYRVRLVPPEFNKESKIEFEVVKNKNNVFNYNIKTTLKQ